MHMRELWRQKVGLAIAFALALLAATRILYGISIFPPSLTPNSLGLASASTQVLVDTPRPAAIDLRQDTYNFTEMTNRALLLGNVIASPPVRDYIARRAGVPADLIKISPPLTPEQPRPLATSTEQPKSTDILKSPNEYRLSVQSNPTVPIIDIDSEAPSAAAAGSLANAAVHGLREYLGATGRQGSTPRKDQVRLVQLGGATAGSINSGAGIQFAALAFLFVFSACCAVVILIGRVRRGWVASEGFEAPPLGDST